MTFLVDNLGKWWCFLGIIWCLFLLFCFFSILEEFAIYILKITGSFVLGPQPLLSVMMEVNPHVCVIFRCPWWLDFLAVNSQPVEPKIQRSKRWPPNVRTWFRLAVQQASYIYHYIAWQLPYDCRPEPADSLVAGISSTRHREIPA